METVPSHVLRLVKDEVGGERGVQASFDGEEEIRRDGHTRHYVLEDQSLMFKFLPLRCSEGKLVIPSSSSTHHYE